MRKFLLMVFLPMVLFALERVNLIKDAGFEKNSELWNIYTGASGPVDSAKVSRHSQEYASKGLCSSFSDTRAKPGAATIYDTTIIIQGFSVEKVVSDIDSLSWDYAVFPLIDGILVSTYGIDIGLYIDASEPTFWTTRYITNAPDLPPPVSVPPEKYLEVNKFPSDTLWHSSAKGIRLDLLEAGISSTSTVDSIILRGFGSNYSGWRAQKFHWDNIRLTGYADYDVGVKDLLSPDSIGSSESSGESLRNSPGAGYIPVARIKNFGRKPADSFLVIASIEGGSGVVYVDTLSWSLAADTEDTLSFKEFEPSDASNYTLTVSTVMTPDESDEDDMMSKTLYGTGIEEPVTPLLPSLILDVAGLSSIRYSLPLGQQGTLSLYDPAGRRVESLRVQGSGRTAFSCNLCSGVYFICLESDNARVVRKILVL